MIVKPNVKEFTSDGYGVIFEDNSKVEHIDAVLMATGFQIAFPYLKEDILSAKDNQVKPIDRIQNYETLSMLPFRFDCINTFGHHICHMQHLQSWV